MPTIDGDGGNNSLSSGGSADLLRGFGGNDTINAGGGADRLEGGTGNEGLRGGAGTDTLADVLVAAHQLENGRTIVRAALQAVTQVPLLFDRQDVVQSEGLWSESVQPAQRMVATLDLPQRDEVLRLFPELAARAPAFKAARNTQRARHAWLAGDKLIPDWKFAGVRLDAMRRRHSGIGLVHGCRSAQELARPAPHIVANCKVFAPYRPEVNRIWFSFGMGAAERRDIGGGQRIGGGSTSRMMGS